MPVDPTRRRFLSNAAGVAAGGTVLALATIPPASAAVALAGAALASADASDPIYAAIERHKQTAAVWGAAADVRSHFNDLHMTAEQRDQRDELDDALDDARALCDQAGIELINTAPTTLAGIVAAIGYIRIQMRDDGTFMPHHLVLDTGGDAQETMGWIDAFLATIANAAAPGKAVA